MQTLDLSTEKLDVLCGVKKPQTPCRFDLEQRVVTNNRQFKFYPGRVGTIVGFNEYNLPLVRLDILPRLTFPFHPSHLDSNP